MQRIALLFAAVGGLSGEPANACVALDASTVATMVKTIAIEEQFDPELALAVAEAESAMGRNMVSDAGATGVMQLMPGTAADLGVADRCDATANIRGGIRYLKSLFDEFEDPLLALAAYNAGKGRVYEEGGIPEFEETAKYVVRVMNRWKLTEMVASRKAGEMGPAEAESNSPQTAEWRDTHVLEIE